MNSMSRGLRIFDCIAIDHAPKVFKRETLSSFLARAVREQVAPTIAPQRHNCAKTQQAQFGSMSGSAFLSRIPRTCHGETGWRCAPLQHLLSGDRATDPSSVSLPGKAVGLDLYLFAVDQRVRFRDDEIRPTDAELDTHIRTNDPGNGISFPVL